MMKRLTNQMKRCSLVLAILAAAVVGCTTIRDAREAQSAVAGRLGESVPERPAADWEIPSHGFALSWYLANPVPARPSLTAARLAVKDARLALRQIAANAPLVSTTPWNAADVSVSVGYSESSAGTTFKENEWSTDGDPSASLSLEVLVYDFGRNAAEAKAQAERVIAAEESLIREGYAAFNEVSGAYFSACEQLALFEAARTNETVFAVHLEQVERLYEAGEAKELDVLRARLDLAQAHEATVSASNGVVSARADFLHTLGSDHPQLVGSVAALESDLKLGELMQAFAPSDWTVESAWTFAATNAPAVKIARARVKAASAGVDAAIADLYPTLSVSSSLSWTDPLWYLRWGGSAVQSLFTGFRKTTAVDRAVVAMQTAVADLDQAEEDLRRDLKLALASRDTAREALRAAEDTLATARENLKFVAEQYEIGEADRVDYSDAVRAVSEALGSRAAAFYRGQRSEAALFALIGLKPVYAENLIVEQAK